MEVEGEIEEVEEKIPLICKRKGKGEASGSKTQEKRPKANDSRALSLLQ